MQLILKQGLSQTRFYSRLDSRVYADSVRGYIFESQIFLSHKYFWVAFFEDAWTRTRDLST